MLGASWRATKLSPTLSLIACHSVESSTPWARPVANPSPMAAALREAEEEVGLSREQVDVLGAFNPYITGTGFRVTPFVGLVHPAFQPITDDGEVAEVFEVPLQFLFEPANQQRSLRTYFGVELPVYEFLYHHWRIWGVTAGVLMSFYLAIHNTKENS